MITVAYRWWGRVIVVCCIVIVCLDVWWILHFTLHNRRLRDALPMDVFLVVTSDMRILKYDIYGQIMTRSDSEERKRPHLAV